jgi:acetyl-CoA/propionyl-CoA carboxylase biotin carboxyl carrier protein
VAVYAEPDRDALHVKVADEAYALNGSTPVTAYLVQDKLIAIAKESGADAVHPGYGFLAENAGFAQAVIDAGLIWIGPGPAAIDSPRRQGQGPAHRAQGQRPARARHVRPGLRPDEVVEFAKAHGLPSRSRRHTAAADAASRSPATIEEIPELYDSAVREAVTAFGRGECFVERFLDHPRHVETQCLADQHGNVVVVSTRDCSLQRRNQKLVEEAPAPFLTEAQHDELVRASKAILKEAGYVGAGTCEFLVGPAG